MLFNVRPLFHGERGLDSFNIVISVNQNNILHLIYEKYVQITNRNIILTSIFKKIMFAI